MKDKLQQLSQEKSPRRPSLRDTLTRLYLRPGTNHKLHPDDSFSRARRAMHEFVNGEYVNTHFGDVFIAKVRYPKDSAHGNVPLLSLSEISDRWLSRWGKFPQPSRFDWRKTIFVDTETSGLAGGGGTIPFLIGIGYFYRNQFRIEQFFADSHAVEEGMLELVIEFVRPFDTVVTFNGKTFDIPLLETRYILKRKQSPFTVLNHLDLLHPSRQMWGLTLEDCKLQTLERKILGFRRDDDLPGEEVPYAYFNYIRRGNPDPLYKVFRHNADDIASLAAILFRLWEAIKASEDEQTPQIHFSRGKILNRLGEKRRAVESFKRAREGVLSSSGKLQVSSHLSMLHKSEGRWRDAEALWLEMIEEPAPFHLLPYVELAKYYEHKTKDMRRAKKIVESCLGRIPEHRMREIDELNNRLSRLVRKIEKRELLKL
ncbi:MAG: ribonuclease H-like domain-containing protein [Candidatus Marinimicrobia bacterium]|nr:ribonuclease H-like domain-containing protein [Candidatus Neomarinimicrobiota bacterium]